MNAIIDSILNWLLSIFKHEEIVTVLISILPIVEVRGAIPIGIGYGLKPLEAWFYAFIGSSLIVPVLLLALIPFINWLKNTKLFRKIGTVLYEKFESKTRGVEKNKDAGPKSPDTAAQNGETADFSKKSDIRKMLGIFLFVAVPLPLTGVWTGSAIAAILKLKFPKALLSVVAGNLVASTIMTVLCVLFKDYVNIITLIIGIAAILIVAALILKIILHKPKTENINEEK